MLGGSPQSRDKRCMSVMDQIPGGCKGRRKFSEK
jgi:hypothetical protein